MTTEIVKIDFNGDALVAFEEDGKVYISVQQACIAIGIEVWTQFKKLRNDPVAGMGIKNRSMTELFGNRETIFLERKHFHRWLNSIQPARVTNEAVREKLIKYQLECTDVIDDYFSKGAAVNEKFLKAAPEEFINNLADTIAAKLGKAPTADEGMRVQNLKIELAERRMQALGKVSELFGNFDNETRSILQQQAIADVGYNVPNAPTWQEIDRWYAADFWEVKKSEGWKNAFFKTDAALVIVLGKYASQASRKEGYELFKVPQVAYNGRRVHINQYREEALELAFDRLAREGKVVQQKVIQMKG